MSSFLKYLIFFFALFPATITGLAQPGFFIPKSGKIFFKGDTATIFSNVRNEGSLGIGKNAFINFTATSWQNDPQSIISDESNNGVSGTGGWVRFMSDSFRQRINGGYNAATKSGPSFSHLSIQNKLGVELFQSNAKVKKQINFSNGLIYLHDYIIVIGDNDPGKISGYDSTKYFVTDNKAGKGLLIRENITGADGRIVFPIGTKQNSFTPAAVLSKSNQGDDYYVNVFDSVRSAVSTGNNLLSESVNKTWQIGKLNRPGLDDVEITLQHLNADEGNLFTANKQNAYISQFNRSAWDTGGPQNYPGPGYLTSGMSLTNSGTNSRVFSSSITAASYFTKLTDTSGKYTKTNLWFNAYRLDTGNVYCYWKTNPEINVKWFVVQRQLSYDTVFRDVAILNSRALGGSSFVELDYSKIDPNNDRGIGFYRLLMINYANDSAYSDAVAVGNKPGEYSIMLWPNPAADVFTLSIHKTLPAKAVVIWNVLGQKVHQEDTNGRTIIKMGGLKPGVYFVSVIMTNNVIIQTLKLVVVGN